MAYGFQVTNNNNVVQIDDSYVNYQFKEQRMVTTTTNWGLVSTISPDTKSAVQVNIDSTYYPIIVHRNTLPTLVMGPKVSGSTYIYYIVVLGGGVGTSFPIWIFEATNPQASPGKWGIEVYTPTAVAFSSERNTFKPTNVYTGTYLGPEQGGQRVANTTRLGITQMQAANFIISRAIPNPNPGQPNQTSYDFHWMFSNRVSESVLNIGRHIVGGQTVTGTQSWNAASRLFGYMAVELDGLI